MADKHPIIRINKKTIRNVGGGIVLYLADEVRDLGLEPDDEVVVRVEDNDNRRIIIEAAK